MQRYFGSIENGSAHLSQEDNHHFLNVMRGRIGDVVEILSNEKIYKCRVKSISPLLFDIIEENAGLKNNKIKLQLAYSLLKKGNDDLVLQKCVELGCEEFHPFISSRTIIRINGDKDSEKKKLRGQKIIKEAVTQSKGCRLPFLDDIKGFQDILNFESDLKLIAYEGKSNEGHSILNEIKKLKPGMKSLVVIGPEGGFSEQEVDLAISKGFIPVGLGRRILRAETASIFVASLFSLLEEENS